MLVRVGRLLSLSTKMPVVSESVRGLIHVGDGSPDSCKSSAVPSAHDDRRSPVSFLSYEGAQAYS